jgi:hypothetical protein
MGLTVRTPQELEQIILKLASEWPGDDYNLIHHNCLHFCNALCDELGVGKIPGWVDRLARTAAGIDKTRNSIKDTTRATAEAADHLYRKASGVLQTADAQQLASKAQESASKMGSNIWSWGKGLQSAIVGSNPAKKDRGTNLKESLRQRGGGYTGTDPVPVALIEDPFCPELTRMPTPQVSLEKKKEEAPSPNKLSDNAPLPQQVPLNQQRPQAAEKAATKEPADLMNFMAGEVASPQKASELRLESPLEPAKPQPVDLLSGPTEDEADE